MKLLYKFLFLTIITTLNIYITNSQAIPSSFVSLSTSTKLKTNLKSSTTNTSTNKFKLTKSTNKSTLTLKELLMAQTGPIRKKRKTKEGFNCAPAFNVGNVKHYDCVFGKTPDGKIATEEWCYLDKNKDSSKTDKVWDYCRPDMNYSKLREKIQQILQQIISAGRKEQHNLEELTPKGIRLLDDFKSNAKKRDELYSKVAKLKNEEKIIDNLVGYLYETQKNWEKAENQSIDVGKEVLEKEEKLRNYLSNAKTEEREKLKESLKENQKYSTGPNSSNIPEDKIKKEIEETQCKIAPWIQEKKEEKNKDCTGMLSYEQNLEGDGLIGKYYDNTFFGGSFKERRDDVINFDFSGTEPMKGINNYNFSIEWSGYIIAPVTGKYKFIIETSGGAELYIMKDKIASINMYSSNKDSKLRTDQMLSNAIAKLKDPTKNNIQKTISTDIELTGGDKFFIKLKFYHSVHEKVDEDGRTIINLKWESDLFEEQSIEKDFLFTENNIPPLKITEIGPELGVMRNLLENDLAFKDSETYILQDIPQDYRGLLNLKLDNKYPLESLEFVSNNPVIVYLARLAHYPQAFGDDFEDLNQSMALLEVEKPNKKDYHNTTFKAKSSSVFKIYKKKFEKGLITIPLNKTGLNAKGIPLALFFGIDTSSNCPVSCGGKELWVSDITSKYFKKCTTSSYYTNSGNWDCKSGLNGKMQDRSGSGWATQGEGVGAWMKIEFDGVYKINSIEYKDRRYTGERTAKLLIEFSTGDRQYFDKVNTDDMVTINIDKDIRAQWVKISFVDVYSTYNNGGSFKVYGTTCSCQTDKPDDENKKIEPLFEQQREKIYNFNCFDSVSNSKKLSSADLSLGKTVKVRCNSLCGDEDRVNIYGGKEGLYSKDSAICKSAFHANVLSKRGDVFIMEFQQRAVNLQKALKNGIQSKSKSETPITIQFKPLEKEEPIPLSTGTSVDYRKDTGSKWEPAYITLIVDNSLLGGKGSKVVTLIRENGSFFDKIAVTVYPDSNRLMPCGTHVKQRKGDCKGSIVKIPKKDQYNIRFIPEGLKLDGDYLEDNGKMYGDKNKPYGWSRDLSDRLIRRKSRNKLTWTNYENIVESYVAFPPSQKSKWCTRKKPVVFCDKPTYSVLVGEGKYNVKLYIKDIYSNSNVDFTINGVEFAKNKNIRRGELVVLENTVEANNKMLEISAECEQNCIKSMGKLNMIQITPFEEAPPIQEEDKPSTNLCNNKVNVGGQCDSEDGDVVHCIFKKNSPGKNRCTGEYTLFAFPEKYNRCPQVSGREYCIRKKYKDNTVCVDYCPGNCVDGECYASFVKK